MNTFRVVWNILLIVSLVMHIALVLMATTLTFMAWETAWIVITAILLVDVNKDEPRWF